MHTHLYVHLLTHAFSIANGERDPQRKKRAKQTIRTTKTTNILPLCVRLGRLEMVWASLSLYGR